MSDNKLAIIAGAGAGLGAALMRRFQAHGLRPVGLSRSGASDADLDIRACDLTDRDAVNQTVGALIDEFGAPALVVHNPASLVISPFAETAMDDFENCWRNMTLSAAILASCVMPPMARSASGTLITSGATASLRGGANFAAFASAKFALRGLTQSLAREYQPAGIHVVHVILDGIIDTGHSREIHTLDPSRMMKPGEIAEVYWQLSQQPRSVWSHEIDLRPSSEKF